MKSKIITLSVLLLFSANTFAQDTKLTDYVDPRIGSEGLGRVFIGPSCPYGMVKPSPDCTPGRRFLAGTRQRNRWRT